MTRARANQWVREHPDPILRIRCLDGGRGPGGRLIAVVSVWQGSEVPFILHGPDGFGAGMVRGQAATTLPCRCFGGHKISPDDVLDLVQHGKRNARVDPSTGGLSPLD